MSPLGGFGRFAFRTLGYLPAVRVDSAESKAKRECLLLANVTAVLASKTLTQPALTWSERVKQIDAAIESVAAMVAA